ncbi:MAG: N-6 DNA methylase [Caulobacterales bacterium]|nr:N-6 DNA methylase [Caulobacterales bacterium]
MNARDVAASWAGRLGLAAEPLFSAVGEDQQEHFALLDGADGSFTFSGAPVEPNEALDWTWSARMRHHVLVEEEQVRVHHVGSSKPPREFDRKVVEERLDRFFDLLIAEQARPSVDVVDHIVAVFRSHRARVRRAGLTDELALKSFFGLIRGYVGSQIPHSEQTAVDAVLRVQPDHTAKFRHELSYSQSSGRHLNLKLTLRHASGAVFQEAHSELANDPSQSDLFGLPPLVTSGRVERLGAYYTPAALARTVADAVCANPPRGPISVLDPACGSGSFLIEAAHALRRAGADGEITLFGADISSPALEMAKFSLAESGLINVRTELLHADFLRHDFADRRFDFVVMNPPYVGAKMLDETQRASMKAVLGPVMRNRPDLSQAFVSKSLTLLKESGRLGTLLPSGVLNSSFGESWRKSISEAHSIKLSALFGAFDMFQSAMINVACLVIDQSKADRSPVQMIWAQPSKGSAAAAMRGIRHWANGESIDRSEDGWSGYLVDADLFDDRASWMPAPNALGRILPKIEASTSHSVTDLFSIELGIRAGDRSLFIVDRAVYEKMSPKEKKHFKPVAEKDAIRQGRIWPTNYIFYPGRPVSVEEVKSIAPAFYRHVVEPRRLADDFRLELARARYERASKRKPRIVSRAFAGPGAFAVDPEGDLAVVQGYSWTLKRPPDLQIDRLHDYSFILNSAVFIGITREFSVIQAGGQIDLALRYMKHVPLPDLDIVYSNRPEVADFAATLRDRNVDSLPEAKMLNRFALLAYGIGEPEWPLPLS